jgi:flagellar hook-associated protein 1 FlgK
MSNIGNLSTALRTAQTGLWTNQQVLDVVANNVANVNTPGYSRKTVNLREMMIAGAGVGVELAGISRTVDQGLLTAVRQETASLKAADVATQFEARIQDLFGTPESDVSIAHLIADLQTAVEALAAAPDGALEASEVVRSGSQIADSLNGIADTLQRLRLEADQKITQDVNEANRMLSDIAELNHKMIASQYRGEDTCDLADQRDRALDRLAELIDIRAVVRQRGDVAILTADGRTLLDDDPVKLSRTSAANLGPLSTYAEGDIDGIHAAGGSGSGDLTTAIGSGEIGGLITLRDRTLPDMQSMVDELAATLKATVNRAHNRGTAFPGAEEMHGSRAFAAPATQRVRLANGDVAITLFDAEGNQKAATTLGTLIGTGFQSIETVRSRVDDWLKGELSLAPTDPAVVTFDDRGRLQIDLDSPKLTLAFRDQASAAPGAAPQDAQIEFDADGNNTPDERAAGFSSFFGLNDFFTDATTPAVQDSTALPSDFRARGAATLAFRGAAGVIGNPVIIAKGDSLATIATKITAATGLRPSIVSDGSNFRLRIVEPGGSPLAITETAGTLLSDLGMQPSIAGIAASLAVRADIRQDASLVARGAVQFDSGRGVKGEYFLSRNDGTVITQVAEALADHRDFAATGSFNAVNDTLAGYAGRLIADASTRAEASSQKQEFQAQFVENLQYKSDSLRGVNLDQELSDLMLYEQAFSAVARLVTVVQKMFDALESAMR